MANKFSFRADLKIFYQPNIKRLTRQIILVNDVVFIGFWLSYDNHVIVEGKNLYKNVE